MRAKVAIVGVLSLLVAASVWWFAGQQFNRLMVTARVVVPAQPIAVYTLIGPDMLTTKEVPRSLLAEPIYTDPAQVIGQVAIVPLEKGTLLYRNFVVPPAAFRLVTDPGLEVIAFPVSVSAAVGGEVRPGQRINIYRAVVDPNRYALLAGAMEEIDFDMAALLQAHAAAVELLAGDVWVVAVQSAQGQRVNEPAPGEAEPGEGAQQRQQQPVQIITVAVSPQTARQIVQLVAEARAQVELWVSLAPLPGALPAARSLP